MKTILYVDGFNLYYTRLRPNPRFKWLNLKELGNEVLLAGHTIHKVKYYTARVSGKQNPRSPADQQAYLNALGTVPEIEVHYGNFLSSEKWARIIKPAQARPKGYVWKQPEPNVVLVSKTEEKGSDVNLASHLVRDALTNQFDQALVLSNDTDLVEPIRIAIQEAGKKVGILCPIAPNSPIDPRTGRRPAASATLKNVASFCIYIHNSHLNRAQFPQQIILPSGKIIKRPSDWC
jgi:uncharacterized LabA/DUF88 family protein